jgi:hypothetical protein
MLYRKENKLATKRTPWRVLKSLDVSCATENVPVFLLLLLVIEPFGGTGGGRRLLQRTRDAQEFLVPDGRLGRLDEQRDDELGFRVALEGARVGGTSA